MDLLKSQQPGEQQKDAGISAFLISHSLQRGLPCERSQIFQQILTYPCAGMRISSCQMLHLDEINLLLKIIGGNVGTISRINEEILPYFTYLCKRNQRFRYECINNDALIRDKSLVTRKLFDPNCLSVRNIVKSPSQPRG